MEETEQDHRHFEEAAPIYATGGLEPKEREAFEAHLESGCTVCFEVLKELQPTTEFEPENPELVHAETLQKIPEHTPPTDDIRTPHTIPEPTESSKGIWPKVQAILTSGVLAVVLVLVAAGAIWFAVSGQTDLSGLVEERQLLELDVKELSQRMERLQDQIKEQANLVGEIRTLQEGPPDESLHDGEPSNDPNPPPKEVAAMLAAKERENQELVRKIAQMTEYEAFVQSSNLQVVPFVGKRSLKAKAFFFYDAATSNAMFYGSGFPALPPNGMYHLWALINKPVRLGQYQVDEKGSGRLWMHNIIDLSPGTKFAVSVETATSVPKPMGDILLLGEMRPIR